MSHVFISYSRRDIEFVSKLYADLQANDLPIWLDRYNIVGGEAWESSITQALQDAYALIVVISADSLTATHVKQEYKYALEAGKTVIPVLIDNTSVLLFPFDLASIQFIDFRDDYERGLSTLLSVLESSWNPRSDEPPPAPAVQFEQAKSLPSPTNKGYAFISYINHDRDFVQKLKEFFALRGYAYWDYQESERDFDTELYRELEERIEGSSVFVSVLSDAWRNTLWTAREYVYAEEANIPVFVVQAKPLQRPVPILLNLRTRIDMSRDFDKGVQILSAEFDKKDL